MCHVLIFVLLCEGERWAGLRMEEESVEDSLTKEMNKLTSSGSSSAPYSSFSYRSSSPIIAPTTTTPGSYSDIRPITTGVLDIKNKYYGIRKNIDSYVETSTPSVPSSSATGAGRNTVNKHRPRAPLTSRFSHVVTPSTDPSSGHREGEDQMKEQTKGKRGDRNKSKQTKRSKKSKSIDVLWESLQHFSKNNLGRSLADPDVSTMVNSPGEGVHFVNLSHDDDPSEDSSSSSRNASVNQAEAPSQRVFSLPREPVERATKTSLSQLTSLPSTNFTIPELPSGNLLTINILSTWGDPHYVGLMGIEIFDKSGHVVRLSNVENQIWANPADINVLSEYGMLFLWLSFLLPSFSSPLDSDPRTVDNLLDGVNHTSDDLHAWLAPFTRGQDHFIYIEFDEVIQLLLSWSHESFRGRQSA